MTEKWGESAPEHHRTGEWFFDPETGIVGEKVFVNAQAGTLKYGQWINRFSSFGKRFTQTPICVNPRYN